MNVRPINPMPDGTCRTIKAQYANFSYANIVRDKGAFAQTGVIHEYEIEQVD